MAIPGIQVINIGLQNESIGSDSLFTAFTKANTNFNTLFTNSSPYNTFVANTGMSINANSSTGTVTFTNTGVTSIVAGDTSVVVSHNPLTGIYTLVAPGGSGSGSGTVTSVGVLGGTGLTVTGSPIISSGNIAIGLASTGVVAGSYIAPTLTLDQYGRVTAAASSTSVGTVTSIEFTPGAGIQITGSPVTTSGTVNIINTGVTRLTAGSGVILSGSTGEITVSTLSTGGTVTSVGVTSNALVVTGSAITSTGTITVDLPTNLVITGNITGGNLLTSGRVKAAYSNIYGEGLSSDVISSIQTTGSGTTGGAQNISGRLEFERNTASGSALITGSRAGALGFYAKHAPSVPGGRIITGEIISSVSFVSGANLLTQLDFFTTNNNVSNLALTLGYDSSAIVYGNLTGGNLLTSGRVSFNGGEDLANLAAVSLATTASYFTTAAAETATLAVGISGQIKTFMANSISAGNMVITVTNAGWKASGTGTMTFSTLGGGCTLQYMNSKWYCIGNNGAVFA